MVNRIVQNFVPQKPVLPAAADRLQPCDRQRWSEYLEDRVREWPKVCLGVAFLLGIGLACWTKRK